MKPGQVHDQAFVDLGTSVPGFGGMWIEDGQLVIGKTTADDVLTSGDASTIRSFLAQGLALPPLMQTV